MSICLRVIVGTLILYMGVQAVIAEFGILWGDGETNLPGPYGKMLAISLLVAGGLINDHAVRSERRLRAQARAAR